MMQHDLWTVVEIAQYVKQSTEHVRNYLVNSQGFPSPVQLPASKPTNAKKNRRWIADEVIAWATNLPRVSN